MRKPLIFTVFAAIGLAQNGLAADGAVRLTNYDSNNPILYNPTGVGASVSWPVANSFVQVLGSPLGGNLQVLSNLNGQLIFTLAEPGFFDGGIGFVPGVPENGMALMQVRIWRSASSWELARFGECAASAVYQQPLGSQSNPARNQMPGFTVPIGFSSSCIIPEPSSATLFVMGLAGVGGFAWVNRGARRIPRGLN